MGVRRETLVGVAWAVGITLAMVSVFFYGLTVYEPDRFDVVWSANEHEQETQGQLSAGASGEHGFLVAGENLTQVRVVLAWSDDVGDPDTFELSVTGPQEADVRAPARSGTEGTLTVSFPLAAAPTERTVAGAGAKHALEQLERDHPWRGDGTFQVTVRLVSAPGVTGTPAGLNDAADDANGYTLRLIAVTHDATLVPYGQTMPQSGG